MPNARKKGKRQIRVWLTQDEIDALRAIAKQRETNMTEIIKSVVKEKADEYGIKKG
jgi:hypothetical protein